VSDNPRRSTVDAFAGFLGEFLREMAVLIAVFAPLDAFTRTTGLTVRLVVTTIAIVAAFFVLGVLLEVKRP
jgi:hypothetical protein